MTFANDQIETLKYILENSLHPEVLDSHPWTQSLVALENSPPQKESLPNRSGQNLVAAVEKIFAQIMPASAPRRGKRLDTQWGEFGVLAAQYFSPLRFGTPSPTSLREAWGRIDQSILFFVYGKSESELSDTEKNIYKLVGDELEVASNSTLSDWHRKGLQHLAQAILARENYLSKSQSLPAVIGQNAKLMIAEPASDAQLNYKKVKSKNQMLYQRRFKFLIALLLVLGFLLWGGLKAARVYDLVLLVRQDAAAIQKIAAAGSTSRVERIKSFGPALKTLRQDFTQLKDETDSFLWLGALMGRVPHYGGDLASARDLVTLADSLLASTDQSYQAFLPLLAGYDSGNLNPAELVELLNQAQPQLKDAQHSLELAIEARSALDVEKLSPFVQDLIVSDVDRILPLLEAGLTFAVEIPRLTGASNEGPKTYLLLAQNEDELRPTGGFTTAASTVVMKNGKISNLSFINSGVLDNWDKLYPAAPWQLNQYMNSPLLIFRDTNWFTNFPTAALYAEYLYSYTNDHSVDGIIAFDQHLLIEVLRVAGPIQLDDAPFPIGADNITQYMREAKQPNTEEIASPDWIWENKAFLNKIAYALIEKMVNGEVEWESISVVLLNALNEHHILLQLDNPAMTNLLARYHWDGMVRPDTGDFLMAVDTNIGFNKTNAVVESSIVYDVDLTDPAHPIGSLTILHKNNSQKNRVCKQWLKDRIAEERSYPITDCYWNYLRIYKPSGTTLISATPQLVPDLWMINKQKRPGQVDILKEEIDNVQSFGTLQVVPAAEALSVNFQFALPANVLQTNADQITYLLKIQKQPGTLAVPLTLRVHLANNMRIETTSTGAVIEENSILYTTSLKTDLEFEIVFALP